MRKLFTIPAAVRASFDYFDGDRSGSAGQVVNGGFPKTPSLQLANAQPSLLHRLTGGAANAEDLAAATAAAAQPDEPAEGDELRLRAPT